MTLKKIVLIGLSFLALNACGGGDDTETSTPSSYSPAPFATWQWQLKNAADATSVNDTYAVEIYDIDLFDVPKAEIVQLQAVGKKVICYFSAGSYEDWRSDEGDFPVNARGNDLDGWPGEEWLDIRSSDVKSIMSARLELAKQKGCDGVEPDNVDAYTNNTGFALTANDQVDYNLFLASEAHARGLLIALKNDLDQIVELEPYFDFAVNEECFEEGNGACDKLAPFIAAGKAVLSAEYKAEYVNDANARAALCADSINRSFSTLILPLDLDDSFRYSCL